MDAESAYAFAELALSRFNPFGNHGHAPRSTHTAAPAHAIRADQRGKEDSLV